MLFPFCNIISVQLKKSQVNLNTKDVLKLTDWADVKLLTTKTIRLV